MPQAGTFKIAINMAGAVSAGAYTAGVLDFLVEALEEWQKQKDAFRVHLKNPAPPGRFLTPVPLHGLSIEALSGASAGGMCAALSAVMLQRPFAHITDATEQGTDNTFYEAWVNQIDISGLLGTEDLGPNKPLISLLDSTPIDKIAESALAITGYLTPPFLSPNLTLFLTVTNARGVPYRLYADPTAGLNEFTTYYADRLRFEVVQSGHNVSGSTAKALPLDKPNDCGWCLLKQAAKASGAFPLFLASRVLTRDLCDYAIPMWVPICGPDPGHPIVSDLPGPPMKTIDTLNIDGGVTDNDPFDLAHDFLASMNPEAMAVRPPTNPREPLKANCAVISVAPFPSLERYDPNFVPAAFQGLFQMLGRLFTILLSQSRFQGESLEVLTSGAAFSRFVIAPSDSSVTGTALQCASLGAFGGFMARSFRAHDFLLGRRNCQRFLMSHFRLPMANPILAAGLAEAKDYANDIQAKFKAPPPDGVTVPPRGDVWMPVIPLVGSASSQVQLPTPGTISMQAIHSIADEVIARISAIKTPLLNGSSIGTILKPILSILCAWPGKIWTRRTIVDLLSKALAPYIR